MHPPITSHQNPKIKNVLALEKARERNQQNVFILEGIKELSLALEGKYTINTIFFCPQIVSAETILTVVKDENLLIPVQQNVFEKIAYRDSTGGIIAIVQQKKHTLDNIRLRKNPLILILESVEKPGNLGAVLRTADAAEHRCRCYLRSTNRFLQPECYTVKRWLHLYHTNSLLHKSRND